MMFGGWWPTWGYSAVTSCDIASCVAFGSRWNGLGKNVESAFAVVAVIAVAATQLQSYIAPCVCKPLLKSVPLQAMSRKRLRLPADEGLGGGNI